MKKIYTLALALLSFGVINAQDTLSSHFTGTPTIYTTQAGVVGGNNEYGDLAKMQLFDQNYGVTTASNMIVTDLLLWFVAKAPDEDSLFATIWEDNNGEPGAVIARQKLMISDIDTSAASVNAINGVAAYNVAISFPVPPAVPANQKFWAGVELPQDGGFTGLYTNTDGDFADAATHAGEFWSDNTFHTFGDPNNWDLGVALAVFPVLTSNVSTANIELAEVSMYNANNIVVLENNANYTNGTVTVISANGSVISTQNITNTRTEINLNNLANGIYVVNAEFAEGVKTLKVAVSK